MYWISDLILDLNWRNDGPHLLWHAMIMAVGKQRLSYAYVSLGRYRAGSWICDRNKCFRDLWNGYSFGNPAMLILLIWSRLTYRMSWQIILKKLFLKNYHFFKTLTWVTRLKKKKKKFSHTFSDLEKKNTW